MSAGDPILNLSDLVNLATGGNGGAPEQINWHKSGLIAGAAPGTLVAGRISSLWRYDGQPSGASATLPTTSVVVTNATSGALKQTTSATGARKRLCGLVGVCTVAGSIILYDRCVQHGGLDGTVQPSAQTTNLPTAALTRHTDGIGVEEWIEIYQAVGGTGTTLTSSYTNTTPTSGQTSQAITFGGTGFKEQDRILPVALAIGDKGVKAVASVTLAASTTTAGQFGVTLAYPLAILPLPLAGAGRIWTGFQMAGGPLDLGATSDACLAMAWHPNTTTAPALFGQAFFLEK